MKVGFSGTRNELSDERVENLTELLAHLDIEEFHHGDCRGADATAHNIALSLNIPVVIHPPVKDSDRAFCKGSKELREEKSYLARNRDIVDECDILVACPPTEEPVPHSGTWYTINYARKKGKPVELVFPV